MNVKYSIAIIILAVCFLFQQCHTEMLQERIEALEVRAEYHQHAGVQYVREGDR